MTRLSAHAKTFYSYLFGTYFSFFYSYSFAHKQILTLSTNLVVGYEGMLSFLFEKVRIYKVIKLMQQKLAKGRMKANDSYMTPI